MSKRKKIAIGVTVAGIIAAIGTAIGVRNARAGA
jgi:hypothetical protein